MAAIKLNNVTALSETGGVATFGSSSSTLKYPAGHIVQIVPLQLSAAISFTDTSFADLTGAIVEGWTETAMGEDEVQAMKDGLDSNIDEQITPTSETKTIGS